MNHLMIDIETMGKANNAAIFQIAAVFFDPQTGATGAGFSQLVSLNSCINAGLTMDAETVLWWMEQSDDARPKSDLSYAELTTVLSAFSNFILENSSYASVRPWGNGISFDLVILKSAFQAVGIDCPWRFYNERDVRTIVELGRMIAFDPKKEVPFKGVKHEALADCQHQIEYVSAITQRLTKAGKE